MAGIALGLIGSFPTPVTSSFESIASQTLSSSTSTISFTSIPSTYKTLQLRVLGRTDRGSNDDFVNIRFNSDSGSNYTYHIMRGDGSSVLVAPGTSQASIDAPWIAASSASANIFGTFITDIHDYASTSKNKTTRTISGYDLNGSGSLRFSSGLWLNTAAITSITLIPGIGTNFVSGSVFSLYGIKGA